MFEVRMVKSMSVAKKELGSFWFWGGWRILGREVSVVCNCKVNRNVG